jgi:hypothetical protein
MAAHLNLWKSKEGIMKLPDVRSIAKLHNIKPARLSKTALIRTIQDKEGSFNCFGTAYRGECDQSGCLWRVDCFASAHHKGELS